MQVFSKKCKKNFGNSKKSSTFAAAFEKKPRYLSSGGRAMDWKSMCPWFNSKRYHKEADDLAGFFIFSRHTLRWPCATLALRIRYPCATFINSSAWCPGTSKWWLAIGFDNKYGITCFVFSHTCVRHRFGSYWFLTNSTSSAKTRFKSPLTFTNV